MIFTNLTRANEIGANSYLLEVAGRKLVLDSGMHPRAEGEAALPQLNLLPDNSVDAIVVTHAHQDHLGSLPVLMRRQRRAPAFMTEATAPLADIMLHNSVSVMTRRAEEAGAGVVQFTHREVDQTAKRWRPAGIQQRFDLSGERLGPRGEADVSLEFYDAGHILGAAGVLIRAEGRTVFYTGDVNFFDQTLTHAARFPEEPLDTLIIETTRGDHATDPAFTREAEERRFCEAIRDIIDHGGSVLVPVFALGKTQEVVAMLLNAFATNQLREVPIYIGGLSTKLSDVFDRLAHHTRRQKFGGKLMDARGVFTLAGAEAFSTQVRPGRVYALSSGMMTENTISNNIARQFIADPRHGLYFVGYADPESPAGRIRETAPGGMVRLSPDVGELPLRCRMEQFSFSGHSTRESIREYVNRVRPKNIVLVHGDPPALSWFQQALAQDLPESQIIIPPAGEAVTL